MFPTISSFQVLLETTLTSSNIGILYCLIDSFFCVRFQVTTRSLSRYSKHSLSTLFRFLSCEIDWLSIRILLFMRWNFKSQRTYIFATDETVEKKSGKCSYGLSKFYSSSIEKPIAGICFSALSLIDVESTTSFMIHTIQVVHSQADKLRIAKEKAKRKAAKKRLQDGGKPLQRGRKKGGKNKVKESPSADNASLRAFKDVFTSAVVALSSLLPTLKVKHIVGDTAYGNENYLSIISGQGLFLISKLYRNAALFEVRAEPKVRKAGRPALYGKQFDLSNLDRKHLKSSQKDDKGTRLEIYQIEARSKAMKGRKLNVVVQKAIRKDGKVAIQLFFSSDLELDCQTLIKYYRLRFQIEFDFRDAKQHFGLSDFKNYKEKNLTNFVNLSLTMTLISKSMLEKFREKYQNPKLSILDLKVYCNHKFHAKSIINWFVNNPKINFNSINEEQFLPHDLINPA
jgi:putative transposase